MFLLCSVTAWAPSAWRGFVQDGQHPWLAVNEGLWKKLAYTFACPCECVCVCMFVWSCGFIRGLLSADAVTCCEAGVSEACHTSQHCHCFKDTLGVLGHLLLSDNISPQQNKGWLFVFTEIMFWMWVWGEMQSFIRWKCLHAWKSPVVTPLYCNHPFSCSGWWNALIGRCWEPAKCCLFTQLHQSKQTNTGQPKNMEI